MQEKTSRADCIIRDLDICTEMFGVKEEAMTLPRKDRCARARCYSRCRSVDGANGLQQMNRSSICSQIETAVTYDAQKIDDAHRQKVESTLTSLQIPTQKRTTNAPRFHSPQRRLPPRRKASWRINTWTTEDEENSFSLTLSSDYILSDWQKPIDKDILLSRSVSLCEHDKSIQTPSLRHERIEYFGVRYCLFAI
eukprot:TRINITY_DN24406_c0_g1_i1.p1 TRINITY_DN24406_c0_g1~~TRINITY_DN24406_c0_g1_i1.p1  ORF type:complete len:195 (+),score=14.23 TRINITY_DN24406_c0_g1_i1:216-800(+)